MRILRIILKSAGIVVVCGSLLLRTAWAAEPRDDPESSIGASSGEKDPAADDHRAALLQPIVRLGIDYLRTQGQQSDGSYSSAMGPSVTALATTALVRNGVSHDDPAVIKAVEYLQQFVQPDGGIYQKGTPYRNYETCLATALLAEVNQQGQYDETIAAAEAFIKQLQWDQDENVDPSDPRYGGAGYGKHRRPDLSNTSFFIDTLKAVGRGPEDEALQKALAFVSRCQNRYSQHNTTEFATRNPDGGFYYTPAAGGQSQAGTTANGGLRSYASMTYAGLKSMIYAGVEPEDPRVQAAYDWIREHYSLRSNPGMQNAGLYYYYHTFAKALDALGVEHVVDADGTQHDWRMELIQEVARRQRPDGSWVNTNARWFEGDPNLVTSYALLALGYCQPAGT